MRALTDLKEMLEDDVKKITKKGDISPDELSNVYKAIDIIKDIETIKAMREHGDYSQEGSYNSYGNSYRRPYYSYDGNSMEGNSMTGSYARRGRDGDNDGRYNESSRGSYDNYSRHTEKEQMVQKLEAMLQTAKTEEQRKAIMRCIDEM